MTLSVAYNIARTGLGANSALSSVTSRNVATSGDPNASAKRAGFVTDSFGGVRLSDVQATVDSALFERTVVSSAASSALATIGAALDILHGAVGDPEAGTSPASRIGALRGALQSAASSPQDTAAAMNVVEVARDLVGSLHDGAKLVETVRQDAQLELGDGVTKLNELLSQFGQVNTRITTGAVQKQDVSDDLDRRNGIVRDIAELVDVRPSDRGQGDMVLFLGNGATLFEKIPRQVVLDGPVVLGPGQAGQTLRVDGWPVTHNDGLGGKLGGLLKVRDDIAVSFGRQLDEIARGLIASTAERDQSATPVAPDLAGLFSYNGGPLLPASGTLVDGLAASILVNETVDLAQGGQLSLLRDGGISAPGNASYTYNTTGGFGFSDRLIQLIDGLSANQSFDPVAGLAVPDSNVLAYSSQSASWLEAMRSSTGNQLEDKQVVAEHALNSWQGRIGINLDSEMTDMITLQRSYQASSRLLTSVNSMFDALFRAMG
jgi:flagellar hook-associated protein 1 FlgK